MKLKKVLRYICCYTALIALLGASFAIPTTLADGADAELHEVVIAASPSSQGIGGIILLDAAVYFYGGCCYHLYANDVRAELLVPEGVEIIQGAIGKVFQ